MLASGVGQAMPAITRTVRDLVPIGPTWILAAARMQASMSLTSHLRSKGSPVRAWINGAFPQLVPALRDLRRDLRPDLEAQTLPALPGVPPSTMGVAIDYRIRFYMGPTPARALVAYAGAQQVVEDYLDEHDPENAARWRHAESAVGFTLAGAVDLADTEVAGLSPAAFFASVDQRIAAIEPVGRVLSDADERELDAICWVLALFEEVFRYGAIWDASPLTRLVMEGSAEDVLRLVPEACVSDLAAVSQRMITELADQLRRPSILNPTFVLSEAVGGSDADVVIDGCLTEIKCTMNPRLDPEWFRQLLGYVLLDADDACAIHRVGFLLPRQAVLVSWPLDRLLTVMIGPAHPSLAELRAEFTQMLESSNVPLGGD